MKTVEGITMNPKVMIGKPCIAGTRITVELILEKLAHEETPEEIIHSHPRLTLEGIQNAIRFALEILRNDIVYPLEPARSA